MKTRIATTRIATTLAGGALGVAVGAGSGIVGGAFGAVPGVGVFALGGAIAGCLAGPDAGRALRALRRRRSGK